MKKKNRKNHITLKWGTLKSCDFSTDEEGIKLLKEYSAIGSSLSSMCQKDTPRQKEIICKLIDLCYGKIFLDWDGKLVSKKEAKEYIMNYTR